MLPSDYVLLFSPDVTPSGWLGSKHQPTNKRSALTDKILYGIESQYVTYVQWRCRQGVWGNCFFVTVPNTALGTIQIAHNHLSVWKQQWQPYYERNLTLCWASRFLSCFPPPPLTVIIVFFRHRFLGPPPPPIHTPFLPGISVLFQDRYYTMYNAEHAIDHVRPELVYTAIWEWHSRWGDQHTICVIVESSHYTRLYSAFYYAGCMSRFPKLATYFVGDFACSPVALLNSP